MKNLTTPAAVLIVGAMISLAVFFGLKSAGSLLVGSGKTEKEEVVQTQPTISQEKSPSLSGKTSIDDDPILGNKETAKVAIVEFSDYECPFCNQFRTQTLGQIKKDYLDTGKAILVYRDLPLAFHNPAAEREAMAAECARDQGGDEKYFQFHDKIFETTPGNGAGIDLDGLAKIAGEINLDGNSLSKCVKEEKFKEEVAKDAVDAAKAGISGTPGFVVGRLGSDGRVEGTVVKGAQAYSVFKQTIDSLL